MQRHRTAFHRALGASLVLHLLLLFVVIPGARKVWPVSLSSAPIFAQQPLEPQPERPLEFEFVDLAEEREEPPVSDQVPLSDLDRRAHGGVGEDEAERPGSIGNTEQLVQSEGGDVFDRGAPPSQVAPPSETTPQTRPQPRPPVEQPRPAVPEPAPEGAGEEEVEPQPEQPRLQLPPTGSWALPPDVGGLPENPDREGGRVDEGGLSFDTQWYDWGPYAKSMLAKVRRHWQIPQIARLGVSGIVRVRFSIERDGTITGVQIIDESGRPPMDFAARDAIIDCINFEPLPAGLGLNGPEGVTITFLYNVASRDRGR